jgi:hypothetical protein
MLIVKGHAVSFDLVDGDKVDAPAKYGMMHDPTGRYWKKTSILIGPYERLREESDGDKYTRDYLGRNFDVRVGETYLNRAGDMKLPPKALSAWTYEGKVEKIWYTRHGHKQGGTRFQHEINKPSVVRFFKGKGEGRLYRCGAWLRYDLSRGAISDGRGFVWP